MSGLFHTGMAVQKQEHLSMWAQVARKFNIATLRLVHVEVTTSPSDSAESNRVYSHKILVFQSEDVIAK